MPTLRFHAVDKERLRPVAGAMIGELAELLSIPTDYFNVEVIASTFFDTEGECAGFPIIEVHAFKRDEELEDAFAKCATRYMQQIGYSESELYFVHLAHRHYYNNGEHY